MGIFQARILEWVAMPSLQGIFPTQGFNPGLPLSRGILYRLSHQGSPTEQGHPKLIQDTVQKEVLLAHPEPSTLQRQTEAQEADMSFCLYQLKQ